MSTHEMIMDIVMCVLWMIVYTLVLIGTIKNQYPLISPITQAIIAPLEFSVLFLLIRLNAFRLDYASIAYLYWSIIEVVIIAVIIRKGYIKKEYTAIYIGVVVLITGVMTWFVTIKQHMFFCNYVNTFIGILLWLVYVIRKKDYPMQPITIIIFVIKLIADILALIVYFGEGNMIADLLCILLPVVDLCFIPVYLKRKQGKLQCKGENKLA